MLMDSESLPSPAKRRRTYSEELTSLPLAEFQTADFPVSDFAISPTATDLAYTFPSVSECTHTSWFVHTMTFNKCVWVIMETAEWYHRFLLDVFFPHCTMDVGFCH